MSLPLLKCLVCGYNADAIHFGATTCRACAAFFRRKVVARMELGRRCAEECKLDSLIKRRLCVNCRFEKCLRVGMRKSAVLARFSRTAKDKPTTSKSEILEQLKEAYEKLQSARKSKFQIEESRPPKQSDYKELDGIIEMDVQLLFENFTPVLLKNQNLKDDQKKHLLSQFLAPFFIFEGAFRSMNSKEKHMLANGDYVDATDLEKYYSAPDGQQDGTGKSASAVFEPFWKMNDQTLRQQLKYIKIDLPEFLFLSALIFWDFGHETLSSECIELCQKMRRKLFEELNEYEKKQGKHDDYCIRVGEIVIVLQAIQKATEIINDSRHVSVWYNVNERHRKFYEIMND